MILLTQSLKAWHTPEFETTFKQEVRALEHEHLPLQAGLRSSSQVAQSTVDVVLLASEASEVLIRVKAGIFYSGIIAGSCCADDPTPVCEENEYCELLFEIDKRSAETRVQLLKS